MASEQKRRKAAAQTGMYLVVIAAIAVVANFLSAGIYDRIDVTKNDRYTLSKGSGRLIQTLKSPVQVDAYVTTGLAQLNAFVRDLTDLLKEYERAGGGKFKYTIIEPKTDELREKAKDAGLQPMAFGEQSATGDDSASIAQGYMGLVFKYGSEKAVIPQLSPGHTEGLEFWITNKIREIRDKADDIKHKIGVVTGKEELKLSDQNLVPKQGQGGGASIQAIIQRAFPYYEIAEVDLKGGDEEIDPELDGLIITQPGADYTDKELRRIDEFLMRGDKSLAVFASAVNLKPQDPSMEATLNLHGIDKLTSGYGINIRKNAVLDFGAQFRIGLLTPTGRIVARRHPGIAHVMADPRFEEDEQLLDQSFPAFFRMDEILMPFPSSVEILRDKQPSDVEIDVIARTTPATTVTDEETVDMKLRSDWEPKPPYEQQPIAAVAKGKLQAAFKGNKGDLKYPDRAPAPSRVMVIASSEFLTNPFAYAGNGPDLGGQFAMFGNVGGDRDLLMIAGQYAQNFLTNTILSVKNTLDWISGDQDLLAASAKLIRDPNLTYRDVDKPKIEAEDDEEAIRKKDEEYRERRSTLQRNVQWLLTLGMPFAFAFFGLMRWRSRQSKKSQLKL